MKTQARSTESNKRKMPGATKTRAHKGKSRSKSAASRRTSEMGASLSGYSQQAQNLIGRSKSALSAASGWAEETAKQLPGVGRALGVPGQRAAADFVEQRPLVVGALGFGIGLVAGALLPKMSARPTARRKK